MVAVPDLTPQWKQPGQKNSCTDFQDKQRKQGLYDVWVVHALCAYDGDDATGIGPAKLLRQREQAKSRSTG